MTVFRDKLEDDDNDITTAMERDNTWILGDDVLCTDNVMEGDDIGVLRCFTVTHPTFEGWRRPTYIDAVDGVNAIG